MSGVSSDACGAVGPHGLYVHEIGVGLPIVVVHGGPDFDHEYLRPEVDALASAFRVVYYDQRGRGRSRSPVVPSEVTMASEVADLDAVRQASGSPTVAVLGHSWGGLLALEYALAHPGRVSHLILVNTAPAAHADAVVLRAELARRRTATELGRLAELRQDPAYLAGDLALDAEYNRIHYRTALHDAGRLDELVGRLRRAAGPDVIVAARRIEDHLYDTTWAREDYDLVPRLGVVTAPTLVIHGEGDFVPVSIAERIAGALPQASLLLLRSCGHFAFVERPEETIAAIIAFLMPHAGTRQAPAASRPSPGATSRARPANGDQ